MLRNTHSFLLVALSLAVPAGSLIIAGCSKGEAPPETASAPGGPGGRMGGPGGGRMGGPIPATATAAEIFGSNCAGCHGDKGQGVKGPSLLKVSTDSDAEIAKTIHDGKGRMPGFGAKMTEAQLKDVVAYVKKLGA